MGYLFILSNRQLSTVADIFFSTFKINSITVLTNLVNWLPSLWFLSFPLSQIIAIPWKFLVQKK